MQKNIIRQKIERLAKISSDLERNAKLANNAVNVIQAGQMRQRMAELTTQQNELMEELVGMHPDPAAKQKYRELNQRVEDLKKEIKSCGNMEQLKELEAQIETSVGAYVHHFQVVVATLMGAPPPAGPVFESQG